MANMNTLLLGLILLTISITVKSAQTHDLQNHKSIDTTYTERKEEMIELDTDFFSLMKFLEENLPLTLQKVREAGFKLEDADPDLYDSYITDYSGPPVKLNDDVILYNLNLRDLHSTSMHRASFGMDINGTSFGMDIKGKRIMLNEFEQVFGPFKLSGAPRGHSINEKFAYTKMIDKWEMTVLCDQFDKGLVQIIVFSSVERIKLNEETEN